MESKSTILELEQMIKGIFAKPHVNEIDVMVGNQCIAKWKRLTGWQTDNTPILIK